VFWLLVGINDFSFLKYFLYFDNNITHTNLNLLEE